MASHISPKYSNIARPYARAAFEYAKEKKQAAQWKIFLETASYIVLLPDVMQLLANPEFPSKKLFDLFYETLQPYVDEARKNFLLLLANNQRLIILPEVAALFSAYYETLEKRSKVRVVTAMKIEDEFRHKLTQALTNRIQHDVTLHCDVDPSILGGAVIHIGDKVIDGSIRGKLTRLLEFSLR